MRGPSVFVCTAASVWERSSNSSDLEGQGCGGQQGMCCGYWLKAELWRDLLGKCHAGRRAEADQEKNVWFTEMGYSKFLASKQDLHWTSVFVIHFTFQADVFLTAWIKTRQYLGFMVYQRVEFFSLTAQLTIHWNKQENGCSGKPIHMLLLKARALWTGRNRENFNLLLTANFNVMWSR